MKTVLLSLACMALLAFPAPAQVRVEKSSERKISIDFSGLATAQDPAAQLFHKTLENDLRLSGWFQPVRGGAELRLVGTVNRTGSGVQAVCQVYRTADQTRLFAKNYQAGAEGARALAHRAADDIVAAITGRKGFASTRLALTGTRSGKKELYLCDADGGGLMQITRDGGIVVGPNWAPDGRTIVYTSFLRGFPDVYRIDLQSGRREQIARYSGLNTGAAISPDGRDMALILSKDGNPDLYIRNLRSGRLTRLTASARANEASPCWSPDGNHLVYVSDSSGSPQLYIISRQGGTPRRISSRGTENVAPDWGPNGWIACASRTGGRYAIAIIRPDNGETRYLQTDFADYEDPSWAPNGRHLVATRTVRFQSSLYLLDTMNDPPVALLQGGGNWSSPAWSPQ